MQVGILIKDVSAMICLPSIMKEKIMEYEKMLKNKNTIGKND